MNDLELNSKNPDSDPDPDPELEVEEEEVEWNSETCENLEQDKLEGMSVKKSFLHPTWKCIFYDS